MFVWLTEDYAVHWTLVWEQGVYGGSAVGDDSIHQAQLRGASPALIDPHVDTDLWGALVPQLTTGTELQLLRTWFLVPKEGKTKNINTSEAGVKYTEIWIETDYAQVRDL